MQPNYNTKTYTTVLKNKVSKFQTKLNLTKPKPDLINFMPSSQEMHRLYSTAPGACTGLLVD